MSHFEPRPFGKYFLTERVAIGGMAEIYKAKTFGVDGFEKILAIKKILSHYSADKEFITMLTDEAKLVVNLSHANIVQVYDLGRVGDDYFISMEYIDGINLRELIERGKELNKTMPTDVCIYIAAEVCKGLDYAHTKKDTHGKPLQIVHRDISPQNILVSHEGGVKIVDFGIAKAAMNLSQTNVGILKGKVTYMAPEQAFGKPIDNRTDLFSLGLVFQELLTFKRLFRGESQMEILSKIRNTRIDTETIGEDVPAVLRPIIAKCLSYTVKERYQSAGDLQIELTRILYSNYPDFTPRKLSRLLHEWFGNKVPTHPLKPHKEQSILVSATPVSQVNLVHRDDSEIFIETVKPDDDIKARDFASEPSLIDPDFGIEDFPETKPEITERSELTPLANFSVSDMLKKKQRDRKYSQAIIFTALALVILGFAWLVSKYISKDNTSPNESANTAVNVSEKPVPVTVSVLVDSTPSEADVFLDNELQTEKTPLVVKNLTPLKKYTLRFVKEGYVDETKEFTPTDAADQTIVTALKSATPNDFKLALGSVPDGAKIFIDGVDTGKTTPADLTGLQVSQNYKLSLKHPSYNDFDQDFTSTGGDQSLEIKLAARVSPEILVESTPLGASIFVNGVDSGFVTPHTFKDLTTNATASFLFKAKGYDDALQNLVVSENKTYAVKAELKLTPIPEPTSDRPMIEIGSNIAGADVFVDGDKKGVTPLTLTMPAGKHTVVVKKSGYKDQGKTVRVALNDTAKKYHFSLVAKATTTTTESSTAKVISGAVDHGSSNFSTHAKLRVDSTPRGASVKIDGKPRGVTPIVINDLSKGKNITITVSKSGYKTWSKSVNLGKDWTEISAQLAP